MLKYIVSVCLCVITFFPFAGEIAYTLKMEKPQDHYFQVEMELSNFSEKEITVKMPIWSPGSYLAREFAKNVDLVTAKDENGKSLEVHKTSKNAWLITKGKAKKITVNYEVYAFELTVRTSFLDLTHGFVSGSSVFMYVDGHKKESGSLEVVRYGGFKKITTALKRAGDGIQKETSENFVFDNYDQLVDCPIEIGNQEEFSFDAAGVKHHVGIFGAGNYEVEQLKKDMKRVVEAATDVFGQNPNKEYTFIIHNVTNGQGGLEHTNSTTLSVNRWTYQGSDYVGFLSLVAHEYFHLWNVKRIRPVELGPFDYDNENYTSLLWVMEGFTSYYDELLLLRAGYYTKEQYLRKLFGTLNYVEGSPGARVQPVAHASYDAWIKAYRPNENSRNTTISYYSKGAVIAAMLDAKIIAKFNGTKSLDNFMQHIYKVFYEGKGRGFSEQEFKQELEKFIGESMDDFFAKYIHGTEMPNYNEFFAPVGVNVEYDGMPSVDIGASLTSSGSNAIVTYVRRGSSAEDAGLSVNDEIIGCNGMRVDQKGMQDIFLSLDAGTTVNLLIARDEQLYSIELTAKEYEQPHFKYEVQNKTGVVNKNYEYWLRTK